MDSSTANQEMGSQTLESMLVCTRVVPQQEKKPRPADEQALKCPRCDSANTKFCYYNNYSLSQPRYFCKSCRRYWTKGGTLRNVPVGGGCRKNKRSTPSSSSSSSSAKIRSHEQSILPTSINPSSLQIPLSSSNNPFSSSYDHHSSCNDLSLAIARLHKQSSLGFDRENDHHHFTAAMWADPNMSSGEVLGMNNGSSSHVKTSLGLFDALGSGSDDGAFLRHQHHQQAPANNNFFGSLIMGGMNGHDHHVGAMENNGGIGIVQDAGIECDHDEYSGGGGLASTAVMTLKQEIGGRTSEQNRVLWGFPWQINGDNGDVGNNQSSLAGWSNNWQGLLNSPLM